MVGENMKRCTFLSERCRLRIMYEESVKDFALPCVFPSFPG